MMEGKTIVVALVALILGFVAGFALRPVLFPPSPVTVFAGSSPLAPIPAAPRATQYFAAHLDEARRIVGGCRDGSVRGGECANAEQAVTEAEGRDRFKKFMGH